MTRLRDLFIFLRMLTDAIYYSFRLLEHYTVFESQDDYIVIGGEVFIALNVSLYGSTVVVIVSV